MRNDIFGDFTAEAVELLPPYNNLDKRWLGGVSTRPTSKLGTTQES